VELLQKEFGFLDAFLDPRDFSFMSQQVGNASPDPSRLSRLRALGTHIDSLFLLSEGAIRHDREGVEQHVVQSLIGLSALAPLLDL